MKVFRIALLGIFGVAMCCMVSCKKEATPADKVEKATTTLENKTEDLKKEVDKKAEETK